MVARTVSAVIIWNPRTREFEVWYQSSVIGRGTDLDALFRRFPNAELREKGQ